jgi:aspartate kinase
MFANGEVLVQKFGGSSMAGTERIRKVAQRLAEQAQRGRRQAVVVSAMGDTTDDLIGLMRTVQPDTDPCELDQIMATGEIVSAALTAGALQALGIKAKSFHAINLGIRTIGVAGSADIIDFAHRETLARFLKPGAVAVIAGFQGLSPTDDLTTLGRGGSDITAVAIARELGQKVCEKYTDEDGVYTADPRIVPMARKSGISITRKWRRWLGSAMEFSIPGRSLGLARPASGFMSARVLPAKRERSSVPMETRPWL